jgi:predicted ATPase
VVSSPAYSVIETLRIQNYRSIADANVALRPFTILVGANGSGKTNLLRLLADLSGIRPDRPAALTGHLRLPGVAPRIAITTSTGYFELKNGTWDPGVPPELGQVLVFTIDPRKIGGSESLAPTPVVFPDGTGAVQVLDSLKTGDREDLFDTIEQQLRAFVPEIEKLSFMPGANAKTLQVREAGIPVPVPLYELSEGTRLVLTVLAIIYQERKPSIICLEDLDRALHPALFGKIVDVCRTLASAAGAPQILATTHNPYLVDQFVDDEDSIVIVEKRDASTTFTPLRERLAGLDRRSDTLGAVWYSGLVGGVPVAPLQHLPPRAGAKSG